MATLNDERIGEAISRMKAIHQRDTGCDCERLMAVLDGYHEPVH
jgi:hypothetical protein